MGRRHALLSPSSAERWISCPASVKAAEELPKGPDSPYAAEGTAAHAMAELKVRYAFGQIGRAEMLEEYARLEEEYAAAGWDLEEIERHTETYLELVEERANLYPHSQVLVEQKLDTGIPECWGTSDVVIVSPEHLEVIDFKYGQGVPVDAENNPQLRLYALGALRTYGDMLGDTEIVRITVHQPRLNHVLTEEITPEVLRGWRDTVAAPAAELALGDDAPFGPSEDACRWCPLSGQCRAQLEDVFAEEPFDKEPALLSPEELADALSKVARVKVWLRDLEEAALTAAYSLGQKLPGYKVVLSGGRRVVSDPEGALEDLSQIGYDRDTVAPRKLVGIGALEKLLGDDFDTVLADRITRTEGRPSLVDETDRRPSIDPNSEAQREFGPDPTEKETP